MRPGCNTIHGLQVPATLGCLCDCCDLLCQGLHFRGIGLQACPQRRLQFKSSERATACLPGSF